MKPTILSCAVTGTFATRAHNPNLPVTPEEIANACVGAAKAGAAICHIHVRDPATGTPSMKLEYYREVVQRIKKSGTDLIINLTCGPGGRYMPDDADPAKAGAGTNLLNAGLRTDHIAELRPEICTLDLNTNWFGNGAVINSPRSIRQMAERMYASGCKPEIEVFDSGDLVLAADLVADGTLKTPALFQIVTGIKYGFPSTPEMMIVAKSMIPKGCEWAAFGAGKHAFTMLAQAYILGGHCRIGMEDTVHMSRGTPAPSNAALVEKSVGILHALGAKLATVAEARELLGLKPRVG